MPPRRGRHPARAVPAGARRRRHRRWLRRVKNGRPWASSAMQYGPGAENAFPGRGHGVLRLDPDAAPAAGPSARSGPGLPAVQLSAHLRLRDQVRRDPQPWRGRRGHAPRLQPPAWAGRVRSWSRSPPTSSNEDVPDALIDAYRPVKATAAGERARRRGRRPGAAEARRPVILAGQGVLYAEAVGRAAGAGRAAAGPGHDDAGGQERVPGGSSAGARDRRPRSQPARAALLRAGRRGLRHRQQLHQARHGDQHPGRQDASSTPPTTSATSTRTTPPTTRSWATPSWCCASSSRPSRTSGGRPAGREGVRAELERVREAWLEEWMPKLTSNEVPITPVSSDGGLHAARSTRARPSSRTTPAARATSSCPSTARPRRAATWAGASRTPSAPAWASSWAPSSRRPTSSASTSWATPPSA